MVLKRCAANVLLPVLTLLLYSCCMQSCMLRSRDRKLEKLLQCYQEGLQVNYDKDNVYCPSAELAFADSILKQASVSSRNLLITEFIKGFALLKLGEESKAIALFGLVVEQTADNPRDLLYRQAKNYLGLSYLRLGERNNCISGHVMGSCIFPIQGHAVFTDDSATRVGIEIYRQLLKDDPENLELKWLLNLAYMSIGEYPRKVPPEILIKGMDQDNDSIVVKPFRDLAGPLKLNGSMNMSGGVIIDDFDNDGYLDIVTSCWDLESAMHFYKNNGDGTFTDLSKASSLDQIKGGLNIIQADYNNDGYTDILVLRGAWLGEKGKQPNTLLRNNGNGTFTDVTISSGLLSFHPTQTGVWADFNNDGWLDLFIGNETTDTAYPHPTELYINRRDGTFSRADSSCGAVLTGFVKGVAASDYDNDGWPDIFLSMLDGRKVLLKNKGLKAGDVPRFENVTHRAGLDRDTTFTFPTWLWDYDNDGWPDIFACGYRLTGSLAQEAAFETLHRPAGNTSRMYLYHNNGDGTFTNVSKETGLDRPLFAMGANFGDIDNDGWLDMFLGTGNTDFHSQIPDRLFRNLEGRQFVDVTASSRTGNLQKGHGVSFADVDNDGDQDIFVETGGPVKGDAYFNSFFVNPGQNDNSWISIQLEGVKANRSAIGARIEIHCINKGLSRTICREVNSGGSFGASPLRKEIGLGDARQIDELVVKWPGSGAVQSFHHLGVRQFIFIKEGVEEVRVLHPRQLNFDRRSFTTAPVYCLPTQ